MTAVSKIEPALPTEPFQKAIREVNEWRGRCLHIFASTELAVTESLEVLSRVSGRGSNVRRRHLIGQRYEDLCRALSVGGAFEAEGGKALQALSAFRRLDHVRTMLCHGSSEVMLDAQGRWTAVFTCLSFKAGVMHCDEYVLRRVDADERQKALGRDARRLCSSLSDLRDAFGKDSQ